MMTDIQAEMDKLGLLCQALEDIPIQEMLDAFNRADTLGLIVDPTAYHRALNAGDMAAARELLRSARPLQRTYAELKARFADRVATP